MSFIEITEKFRQSNSKHKLFQYALNNLLSTLKDSDRKEFEPIVQFDAATTTPGSLYWGSLGWATAGNFLDAKELRLMVESHKNFAAETLPQFASSTPYDHKEALHQLDSISQSWRSPRDIKHTNIKDDQGEIVLFQATGSKRGPIEVGYGRLFLLHHTWKGYISKGRSAGG